ncbi:Ras-related protein Rab [Acrasis kona]|uniref:Ras-related protein Rab n=1 Tax=Acrasis kona TaxID=1008807 RepID=A0AAW2YI39_9EUKA
MINNDDGVSMSVDYCDHLHNGTKHNKGKTHNEIQFKVIVVGEQGVGKTSLIKRHVNGEYASTTKPTIGVDFAIKKHKIDRNTYAVVQYWDIAGQERFHKMTRVYYDRAVAALVVFDITKPQTFHAVEKWKNDIDQKVFLPDMQPITCILVGNKADIVNHYKIPMEDISNFCRQRGFDAFFETSASLNKNVEQCFKFLVKQVLKKNGSTLPREECDCIRLDRPVRNRTDDYYCC